MSPITLPAAVIRRLMLAAAAVGALIGENELVLKLAHMCA